MRGSSEKKGKANPPLSDPRSGCDDQDGRLPLALSMDFQELRQRFENWQMCKLCGQETGLQPGHELLLLFGESWLRSMISPRRRRLEHGLCHVRDVHQQAPLRGAWECRVLRWSRKTLLVAFRKTLLVAFPPNRATLV